MYRKKYPDEELDEFDEDDQGNPITIENAFQKRVQAHKDALDKMQYFACRGEEK